MFNFETREMEEFEDGVVDVVVDAARFAFLQTLHSPNENLPTAHAAVETMQKQKHPIDEKPREAEVDRRPAVFQGRPRLPFFRAKSKARVTDAVEGEQNRNTKKLRMSKMSRTRSLKIFPHFKSLVACFKAEATDGEQKPAKQKKRTFRHRATQSVQGMFCSYGSRGSHADSSVHRYHQRQDFMRTMLESQLSDISAGSGSP